MVANLKRYKATLEDLVLKLAILRKRVEQSGTDVAKLRESLEAEKRRVGYRP